MERELEVAKALAREAGSRILEFYRRDTQIQWKGVDDPVTAADQAANELIVDELRRQFPNDGILAEETPDNTERLSKSRVWMIDPMDGTKQFIERIGEFAVMIGLAIDGEAQLGAIYQPTVDRLYYAAPGMGAFIEEKWSTKRLRVSEERDLTKMTATLSRSHHSPTTDRICERLGIVNKIQSGSVGLKMGLIAEGRAHIYIHPSARTKQWDTCAPEAVLREAGGVITDTTGEALRYNVSEVRNLHGIIASNGKRHGELLSTFRAVISR